MIDVLVIRLRVEYFLFGDRQIRELMLPRHSLTALVMHGAAVPVYHYCHKYYTCAFSSFINKRINNYWCKNNKIRTSAHGSMYIFLFCAPTRPGSPPVPDLVFLLCVVVLFDS